MIQWNASGSCELCYCNGNVNTSVDPFCDPATGECLNCTNNTKGYNCDTCITGYYTDDQSGCQRKKYNYTSLH